jgi:hypothetical protein
MREATYGSHQAGRCLSFDRIEVLKEKAGLAGLT